MLRLGLLGERHYLLIYVCKPNKMDGVIGALIALLYLVIEKILFVQRLYDRAC